MQGEGRRSRSEVGEALSADHSSQWGNKEAIFVISSPSLSLNPHSSSGNLYFLNGGYLVLPSQEALVRYKWSKDHTVLEAVRS